VEAVRTWKVPDASLVFASDLQRAIETAELLYPKRRLQIDTRFREFNFGDWEGKTYDELYNESLYCQWISDPATIHPPNGEGYTSFIKRVMHGWNQLLEYSIEQDQGEVALVAHGGTIRAILSNYSKRSFWDWHIDQGVAVQMKLESGEGGWRCISLREVTLTENETGYSSIMDSIEKGPY
jgi:alpha-ribazole phosphatase